MSLWEVGGGGHNNIESQILKVAMTSHPSHKSVISTPAAAADVFFPLHFLLILPFFLCVFVCIVCMCVRVCFAFFSLSCGLFLRSALSCHPRLAPYQAETRCRGSRTGKTPVFGGSAVSSFWRLCLRAHRSKYR